MLKNVRKLLILPVLIIGLGAAVNGLCAEPDLTAAKDNYNTFCSKCHGPNGQGNGPAAATLHTQPRNYTDCAKMSKISDDTLFKAIKDGGGSVGLSTEMPSWSKGLEDGEIHGLVAYVRSFCKK